MVLLPVCLIGLQFAYGLPAEPIGYEVQIDFDGQLPVSLFQGAEQRLRVKMAISVRALPPDEDGGLRASNSLEGFEISLFDTEGGEFVPLPLTVESAREFFPDTTIVHTSEGRILKTDAPDLNLPIRLPGLHTRHFPDATFMLLQFPEGGVEEGKAWTYTRRFGDSDVKIEATYRGSEDGGERFDVKVAQSYETLEDEYGNPVSEESEAAYRVKTVVTGAGVVWFSGPKGVISRSEVTAEAVSTVIPLEGGPEQNRRLRTTFKILKTEVRQ